MLRERLSTIRASFRFKIFLIFTSLTAVISALFITLYSFDKISETRRHATKEVHLLAQQLADSIRLPLYAEDYQLLQRFAEKTGRVRGISSVSITAADGRVLAGYQVPTTASPTDRIGSTVTVLSLPLGGSLDNGPAAATQSSGALIGTVHVERGTDDLKRAVRQDILLSCLLALLFWLAVSILGLLVFRKMTRSFALLVSGVEAMQGGDFATRIAVLSADEPGKVALAINELAASLQLRDEENLRLNEELVGSIETEVRARRELVALNRALEQQITERVHAEQAARTSEQALRALMAIMPVGVLLINKDGTVDYANEFLVECFGYRREEIPTLGAWLALAFPDPENLQRTADALREALVESRSSEIANPKPYHARVTCKGGNIRHVLLSNQAQGDQAIVVVIDITDRELVQEQSIKTQKLESLGVLAGGIAHNFNNALTGVLGFISLARSTLEASDSAQEYLQFAEKASLRGAGMAKQLLTFARGGAPVKKAVSLAKIIDEVVALALNGSNVACQLEIPSSLPLVKADEGQLVQVLNNILINAMQAMPDGGTIAVRAEKNLQSCGDANHSAQVEFVSVSISDQGHGIAEEDRAKIFDPYFTTKQTNTGLGLASVHSIIYRHGGHVSVVSQLGKGTTFTICLPSTKEAPSSCADAVGQSGKAAAAGSGSVLVMDDDETIRELTKKTLGFLGYQVVTCVDGKDAVHLYRVNQAAGSPFLAAILDLTVPGGMGGVEAAQQILAFDADAKLIVSSGYSYDPVMARYKNYGFFGAVAKPYRADELMHELSLCAEAG